MLTKKKALQYLATFIAIWMFLLILITYLFDPFHLYHEPYFGLKPVLYERETQVPGSIRTFSYDSVLLGTSMIENCDTDFLNETFDCNTLKITKGSGSIADLQYYLEMAHGEQNLKNVFWGIDWGSCFVSTEVTVVSEYSPSYLFTDTILDDFTYFFNKDILLKKIPLMIAYSLADQYTGGQAYYWADDKDFGTSYAMRAYEKPAQAASSSLSETHIGLVQDNIDIMVQEITSHPDTNYYLMFPPYSLLMWDNVYTSGNEDLYFYMLNEVLDALVPLENAKVYFFQADREIVCNLNLYMDMVHYTPDINQLMLTSLTNDKYLVTEENLEAVKQDMKETYEHIISEEIYKYYAR